MLYNVKIEELIWDQQNLEHIKKHLVTKTEIEEVCLKPICSFESYENRIIILGKTNNKRVLSLVLADKGENSYYLVTARDISHKEKRLINEK